MASLDLVSPTGRLARGPFVIAIVIVYVLSLASQYLLTLPVTTRLRMWSFALLQLVLLFAWYVLHCRRLHDAGRRTGLALGIAILYALAIVLLLLIITTITASPESGTTPMRDGAFALTMFILLYIIGVLLQDPQAGALGYGLLVFFLGVLTPFLISLGFTIWTATRPSAPTSP